MAWNARVPFRLPPGLAIDIGSLNLGDVKAEIVGAGGKYSLAARKIPTEDEARALVGQLAEALRRLALEEGWAIQLSEEIQELSAGKGRDARPWGDWAFAVVYSDDQSIGLGVRGEVGILQTMSSGNAAEHIRAAMQAGAARPRDESLRIGEDLFMDAGFQADPVAAFLLRITVLEVLADNPPHAQAVQEAISRWMKEVEDLDVGDDTSNVRDSLVGSLRHLKRRSITKSVKALVEEQIGSEMSKRVEDLYLLRNAMVHNGEIPERADMAEKDQQLKEIVATILLQRLAEEDARA
jgi:predicted DNA-binding protein